MGDKVYFVSQSAAATAPGIVMLSHGPFASMDDANNFLTVNATVGDWCVYTGELSSKVRVPARVLETIPLSSK